jgi:tetratricopeptide (TPR) repeat protein
MAERLLFFPSIAFCLALALLLCKLLKIDPFSSTDLSKTGKNLFYAVGVILVLFSIKTFSRNKDWKSNTTLFTQDIKTVPNSAHMLMYVTDYLMQKDSLAASTGAAREKRLADARINIDKALRISWLFPDAHFLSGRIWSEQKNYDSAVVCYGRGSALNPGLPKYHNNAGTAYFSMGKYPQAIDEFRKADSLQPDNADHPFNLGSAYGALGESYRANNQPQKAMEMFNLAVEKFKRTISLDPNYKTAYQFLGMTYKNMGDSVNANLYLKQAASMK